MKDEVKKSLDNLYQRYQIYDNAGTRYAYDIYFSVSHGGQQMKVQRDSGLENFRRHIDELMANFKDVTGIYVTDYSGKSRKCRLLNETVEIKLADTQSEPSRPATVNMFSGFAGLGELFGLDENKESSPVFIAKLSHQLTNNKNSIERLHEKNDEQLRLIAELERKNSELQNDYDTLSDSYEQLQDDADDMEDELQCYRERDLKQDRLTGLLGAVVANGAKTLIRQNASRLAGFVPAEILAGFADDEPLPAPPSEPPVNNTLADERKERLDDATTVSEWLQTLDAETFTDVISVIAAMRQNTAYAGHIMTYLKGNA